MSPTMPAGDGLQARLLDLFAPLQLLFYGFLYLPGVILGNPLLLLHPKRLQSERFGALWKFLGPQMALSPEQTPYISDIFERAKGTVLELGPGNGDQLRHIVNAVQQGRVERYVAAEPNKHLHQRLKINAKNVGLDPAAGRLVVLEAGAEPSSLIPALHQARLYQNAAGGLHNEGVFDTVIAVKSMCSAPQHQMAEIVSTIHTFLKPGGEFLFFEHVGNTSNVLTMVWAWLLGWIWPLAMGNCHLNGRVDRVVKEVALFDKVDVRNAEEFRGFNVLRYVHGSCRK